VGTASGSGAEACRNPPCRLRFSLSVQRASRELRRAAGMSEQGYSGTLSEAGKHAQLGLPLAKGTRLRFLKRLTARVNWTFLRHQVAFNEAVTTELESVSDAMSELGAQLAAIRSRTDEREGHVKVQVDDLWAAVGAHSNELGALGKDLWTALAVHTGQLEALGDLWNAVGVHTSQLDALGADVWSSMAAIRELLGRQETAFGLQVELVQRQAFARHHEDVSELRNDLVEMGFELGELRRKVEASAAAVRLRQGSIDLLLDEIRRSLPDAPPSRLADKIPAPMDEMYAELEEAFRGPAALVADRLKAYLPDVLSLDRHGPVLDLGSGRGEWLELMKHAEVDAYGVDLSEDFVQQCRARGLKVELADACEHLAAVGEKSLAAVTAFHLAEHMPVERLIRLIDLAIRAIQPRGLLILETPNPENLVVGASSFYLDPSHVRPLPPDLLAFLLEARGLVDVETRFLHPATGSNLRAPRPTEPWSADLAPLVEAVNARLYGAQDYAVIGRRL
jgi:SAM-dependent methyltransferase